MFSCSATNILNEAKEFHTLAFVIWGSSLLRIKYHSRTLEVTHQLAFYTFLWLQEECAGPLHDISEMINTHHPELHSHLLLSIFKMAEVEVKVPDSSSGPRISTSVVVVLALLSIQSMASWRLASGAQWRADVSRAYPVVSNFLLRMLYLTEQWSDFDEESYRISNIKYWFIANGALNKFRDYTRDVRIESCVETVDFSEDYFWRNI